MERKGQTNKSRGYMLFTGAMILCCIGLYLAQGISWPGRAPAEPTPSPTPSPCPYPAETAFLENACAFGMDALLFPLEGTLPAQAIYRLERPDLEDATLTLSFRSGGVCAFLLEMPFAPDPGPAPQDPTPIESDLYEMRLAAMELEQRWRKDAVPALCAALDITGGTTAVDISGFYALLEETAKDGEARDGRGGGMDFSCYVIQTGDDAALCVGAQLN